MGRLSPAGHAAVMPRSVAVLIAAVCLAALAACDKVPLMAPTGTTITLYANSTVMPVDACDLDGDGNVGFTDLTLLLARWGN